jgi:hypothetical protein
MWADASSKAEMQVLHAYLVATHDHLPLTVPAAPAAAAVTATQLPPSLNVRDHLCCLHLLCHCKTIDISDHLRDAAVQQPSAFSHNQVPSGLAEASTGSQHSNQQLLTPPSAAAAAAAVSAVAGATTSDMQHGS